MTGLVILGVDFEVLAAYSSRNTLSLSLVELLDELAFIPAAARIAVFAW